MQKNIHQGWGRVNATAINFVIEQSKKKFVQQDEKRRENEEKKPLEWKKAS